MRIVSFAGTLTPERSSVKVCFLRESTISFVVFLNYDYESIEILFYLSLKSYRFLGIGLGTMVNRQEFQNLFLVNEIVTTYLGLLYVL